MLNSAEGDERVLDILRTIAALTIGTYTIVTVLFMPMEPESLLPGSMIVAIGALLVWLVLTVGRSRRT